MTDYISIDDLMDQASIDGDYNRTRVESWRFAGIATLENATGYTLSADTVNDDNAKKPFVDLANIFLQEYARSNYLAPNYPTDSQKSLLFRLQRIANLLISKMEEINGKSVGA